MKTIITKRTTTLMLFFFIGIAAQAQFLKKLADRAEAAAERAVIRKTEQKAADKTNKTFDNVFSKKIGQKGGKAMDASILPDSYTYQWRYTLQTEFDKNTINTHYYLRKDGTDYASRIQMEDKNMMGNMLMIMDNSLGSITMLFENEGKKIGQIMTNPTVDIKDTENNVEDFEIKKIGTKQILGYTCQGFQMENNEMTVITYIATNTPVSLNSIFQNNTENLPKGFDPKWLNEFAGKNSLMMEMEMINKKKKKKSAKMRCLALKQEPLTINISNYEFFKM